jgi:hypothetical protein
MSRELAGRALAWDRAKDRLQYWGGTFMLLYLLAGLACTPLVLVHVVPTRAAVLWAELAPVLVPLFFVDLWINASRSKRVRTELGSAVKALPAASRTAPGIPDVLAKIDALGRETERSGRRFFWLGLLLSIPVGIIGAYIAHLVGIG